MPVSENSVMIEPSTAPRVAAAAVTNTCRFCRTGCLATNKICEIIAEFSLFLATYIPSWRVRRPCSAPFDCVILGLDIFALFALLRCYMQQLLCRFLDEDLSFYTDCRHTLVCLTVPCSSDDGLICLSVAPSDVVFVFC